MNRREWYDNEWKLIEYFNMKDVALSVSFHPTMLAMIEKAFVTDDKSQYAAALLRGWQYLSSGKYRDDTYNKLIACD